MTLTFHRRRTPVRAARRHAGMFHALAAVDDDPVLLCGSEDCGCDSHAATLV